MTTWHSPIRHEGPRGEPETEMVDGKRIERFRAGNIGLTYSDGILVERLTFAADGVIVVLPLTDPAAEASE